MSEVGFFLCIAVVPRNFSYGLRSPALYKRTHKWPFPTKDLGFLLGLIIFANTRYCSYVRGPLAECVTEGALHQPKLFLYHNVNKGTHTAYDSVLLAVRKKTPCLYVLFDICAYS